MPIVQVGYHYSVWRTTRGGHNQSRHVRSTMPVEIPEASAGECPRIAVVEGAGHDRAQDGSWTPVLGTIPFHAYAGGFVKPWAGAVGTDGLPHLAPPPESRGEQMWYKDPCLFTKFGMHTVERGDVRWRGAVRSDEDRARASVRETAARMCVLDGVLMVPAPQPVLAVRRCDFPDIPARIEVVPSFERPFAPFSEIALALHETDLAMECASVMARRGGPDGKPLPVVRYGDAGLPPGGRMPYDGLTDYCRGILAYLGTDFSSVHWLEDDRAAASATFQSALARFNGCLEGAVAGEPHLIKDCFESLSDMREAYPDKATTGVARLDALLRRHLDNALWYYRAQLADRPLQADADAEDLASLAPGFHG